jgi:uncharacterized protein
MSEFTDAVKKHKDGALIDLFVTTESDKAIFPTGYNQWRKRLEIKVCSPAKDNRANKEVVNTVADFFDKQDKDISVISGEKSRQKTLFVRNISLEHAVTKLRKALNGCKEIN